MEESMGGREVRDGARSRRIRVKLIVFMSRIV